ncbi:MAG: glutaredoxin family protein [Nitrosospira sp.]|nr:glutaredoxin family protein [Nitrosospira sp.]MBI0409211.1 glutaredoxin family protein [Nitrosospira sp.]MBI0410488.1 glutaredoxin family protein [Nitrosospira sp.]MBI0412175.1 glutaredoxin family protein [Nitrosospira sp.]MBI0420611.1 glutaredoxin family protein [Nitrosospira sp.]
MTLSKSAIESPVTLVIYGREECHLCQNMIADLHELQGRLHFQIKLVDIDNDTELTARYGVRIPVLVVDGEEICHYHLNQIALDAYFARIR